MRSSARSTIKASFLLYGYYWSIGVLFFFVLLSFRFRFSLFVVIATQTRHEQSSTRSLFFGRRARDGFSMRTCIVPIFALRASHSTWRLFLAAGLRHLYLRRPARVSVVVILTQNERKELSPSGANCAPPTYVDKVLSSARESSSRHTGKGVGLPRVRTTYTPVLLPPGFV